MILSLHILYRFYCVICTSARFHEPLCVHVRHPHGPSLHISCMRYLYIRPISRTSVRMSECVKRVTRSEYFGNFLLLSRVSSSALIVHSVVCMSVFLYGRDSFCTVVRGRNLVVRRLYRQTDHVWGFLWSLRRIRESQIYRKTQILISDGLYVF